MFHNKTVSRPAYDQAVHGKQKHYRIIVYIHRLTKFSYNKIETPLSYLHVFISRAQRKSMLNSLFYTPPLFF